MVTRTINVNAKSFAGGGTPPGSLEPIKREDEEGAKVVVDLEIIFWSSDLEGVIPGHNDPWSSPHVMANAEMKKVFVD